MALPTVLWSCANLAAFLMDMVLNAVWGRRIKDLAEAYDHVAIPAGPAFSIWGIIFTWEAVFVVAQFFHISDLAEVLPELSPWFCLTQLMQGLWVPLFTRSDPARVGSGGDVWLWVSTVLLVCTAPCFLKVVAILATLPSAGAAYWVSLGITVNAAWVLLAAGLSVNQAGRALGFAGATLSTLAVAVLSVTVCLELWITGLVGAAPFGSPKTFLPVVTWALLWVFYYLRKLPSDADEHGKRILPLYGSNFIVFYKWIALLLALGALVLELTMIF